MARKATSQDVANLAGVSRSAVSLVLNGRAEGMIAPAKQAAVWEAARLLHYRPNPVALSLRTRRSSTIGLVADLAHPVAAPTLSGAATAVASHDYALLVVHAGEARQAYETLENRQVDGAIVITPKPPVRPLPSLPVVLVALQPVAGVPSFRPDVTGGVRAVMAHLASLGHRRIGVVAGPSDLTAADWRNVESGDHIQQAAGSTVADGHAAAASLLTGNSAVTAVACSSDFLAVGVYLAAAERGLRVPDDVSVLGFDESLVAPGLLPPLTTVRLPWKELAVRATEALLESITKEASLPAEPTILEAELVIRASTGPPSRSL